MAFERFSIMKRNGGGNSAAGQRPPGGSPIGGRMFPGGERPGTYGVGGPMPPQTGGPLPPFQNGGSVGAGPQAPGGSPIGGNMFPGGERPGTYGVDVPGMGGGPAQGGKKKGMLDGMSKQDIFRKYGMFGLLGRYGNNPTLNKAYGVTPTPGKDNPTNDKPTVPGPSPAQPAPWNPTAPFPQNPYDVPAPLNPANNPWLASLPQRDWMTMPSASPGYDQAPPPAPWRPPY